MDGSKAPSAAEEAGDGSQGGARGDTSKSPAAQDGGSSSGAGSSRVPAAYGSYDKSPGAKPRVTFHDPTIPRPQDQYKIMVNNHSVPFDHVWLDQTEDGRPIHPLEKLNAEQFIDRNAPESEPVRPADVEDTPFTLVEDQKGLTALVNKLKDVNEFAVDLEHNQYRSFQGLTCLMQISTRTEDFIIDTLKLRIIIGPYLTEHFKDPTKRKIMHGADRDIMWLQRDFRLYVCNLFDTGQVQERSNEICSQLYEKEQLTDKSYLHIYGLQDHELNAKQLAVVSALYEWRDFVAREQDESTGYVLPNKALIEIAKNMPTTAEDLRRIVKSKYPVVDANFNLILEIVWDATENSNAFEAIAEQLKKVQLGQLDLNNILDTGEVIEMAPRGADNVRISLDSADQYSVAPSSTANIRVTSNSMDNVRISFDSADQYSVAPSSTANIRVTSNSTDNVRISLDSADQYSVAPSSTANIRVTSNSTDSFTTDATLTGSMWLHDKKKTIPSSEIKTSRTLSGLSRPFSKEAMSNNKQETFGALVADPIPVMQTPVMQTPIMQTGYFGGYSNEQAQSDVESSAYYYTQFPEYSSSGGWSPQELQGIPTSGYHDGCYYGHQPSINQSSTGTGQPAARNNAGGFQDWRKQQSSPHPWQPK
ncbi:protein RRP6-like 2 isoform X2 [Lolium perenne]|uniref:protein RRP6-like 2 isoform X2 n=1 Tax=Lolium perenne TaxID=4522 RepID=UPI003A9A4385